MLSCIPRFLRERNHHTYQVLLRRDVRCKRSGWSGNDCSRWRKRAQISSRDTATWCHQPTGVQWCSCYRLALSSKKTLLVFWVTCIRFRVCFAGWRTDCWQPSKTDLEQKQERKGGRRLNISATWSFHQILSNIVLSANQHWLIIIQLFNLFVQIFCQHFNFVKKTNAPPSFVPPLTNNGSSFWVTCTTPPNQRYAHKMYSSECGQSPVSVEPVQFGGVR